MRLTAFIRWRVREQTLALRMPSVLVELLSHANEAHDDNLTKLLARYEYVSDAVTIR